MSSFSCPYGTRGEERKGSVRCTVSWPLFPLTRVRSVETNLTLICPSPTSFICKSPDSGPDSTRVSFSLSQSVETVRRESWERGWTLSSLEFLKTSPKQRRKKKPFPMRQQQQKPTITLFSGIFKSSKSTELQAKLERSL